MKPTWTRKFSRKVPVVSALLMGLAAVSCDGQSVIVSGAGSIDAAPSAGVVAISAPTVTEVEPQSALQEDAPSTAAAADIPAVSTPGGTQAEGLLAAIAGSGDIRVMSMGDSITQGVMNAKSYRSELKQLIADAQCSMKLVGTQSATSPDLGFYSPHEGYSGHTADDFLSGNRGANEGVVSAISHQKPDVVLLHVGSVDIFLGHDVASTIAEIDQLVAAIHDTKPDTLVFIANVIPWYSTVAGIDRPGLIDSLGDQIESYVSESTNPLLYLVDVRSGFSADMMQADLIHPNVIGDAHIADAFFNHIYSTRYCN